MAGSSEQTAAASEAAGEVRIRPVDELELGEPRDDLGGVAQQVEHPTGQVGATLAQLGRGAQEDVPRLVGGLGQVVEQVLGQIHVEDGRHQPR